MSLLDVLIPPRGLEIFLMPIVRFRARRHMAFWEVYGMEALARGPIGSVLRHPEALFAAAREHELETALDLECIQRALWLLPLVPASQRLFINVNPATLFSHHFERLMTRYLPVCWRDRVVMEVLEQEVPCFRSASMRIRWLRELGIQVAIDDVGPDSGDLMRLEALGPVDYVKIDRQVLMRMWSEWPEEARAWLRDTVRLGRSSGARLLIEGVEACSQRVLGELHALHIDLGQGYLFGQPVAALGPSARRSDLEQPHSA